MVTRSARGFTLVETIIVVALIGLLAMVAPRMFLSATRYIRMTRAQFEIQRDSKDAMLLINRALRQAKASSVVVSNEASQPPFSKITFDKFITTSTVRTMGFYQQGTTLYEVSQGSTRPVSSNLRYLAFSYPRTDNSYIVSISLTMEKATYQGRSKALQLAVEKVRIMNP